MRIKEKRMKSFVSRVNVLVQDKKHKMEMTISLKKTKLKSSSSSSSGNKKKTGNFSVGDTVNFHGGTHYVSSDASSGYQVAAGKAKITHSNPGSAHPWCLEGLDWSETHLCGWVDEGTFD